MQRRLRPNTILVNLPVFQQTIITANPMEHGFQKIIIIPTASKKLATESLNLAGVANTWLDSSSNKGCIQCSKLIPVLPIVRNGRGESICRGSGEHN